MTLLVPLGLLVGLSLVALIAFYLLKVQPVDREVSSVYLWERLLPDLTAHQPWQKPRFPPLFYLQAALLLALVAASARPAVFALAAEPVSAVLVLDATASMNAADVSPSRFASARDQVRTAVDALPEGSTATLIEGASQPKVLAADLADRSALRVALEKAQPTDTASDLGDTLRLATTIAKNRPNARVEVFTDGACDLPPDLRTIDVPISWHLIGRGAPNRSITAFSARPDPGNSRRQLVFLRVQRFPGADGTLSVGGDAVVSLLVDGQLQTSRSLPFDAAGAAETVFEDVPETAHVVEARLDGADPLVAGDRATLVFTQPRATRVLLVSRGNVFLEKAIGLLPNVVLDRVQPRSFGSVVPEDYDVIVYDTDVPDVVPARPALIVSPATSPFLAVDGLLTNPAITAWERDHPLLANVDLTDVRIASAPKVEAPGWARAIVESPNGPLVLAGDESGRRVVVLAVDLHRSNLPLTTAFPVLIANAIGYLTPPGLLSSEVVSPGAEVVITPSIEARTVTVQPPSGADEVFPVKGPSLTYSDTRLTGLYRVRQSDGQRVIAESAFAVNLLSAAEADLRPRELPAGRPVEPGAPRPTPNELTRWALGVGLVALLAEWWWYHRG
jgi:hypothetical protein